MKKLKFEVDISAPIEKVWHTMLDDKPYREWTLAFNPRGSWYEGSWVKGSPMLFVGPGEDGVNGGMVSEIADSVEYKYISIKHIGMLMDGKPVTEGPIVSAWTPSYENYTFNSEGDMTKLVVEVDVPDDYIAMFDEMWPRALAKLKAMCEAQ